MLMLVKIFVLTYNTFMRLEQEIIQWLIKRGQSLAITESCTGGLLSHRLTNIPGSSRCFLFSVVAYSNEAKTKLLHISVENLKKHGAVSQEVAIALASGVRKLLKSDYGLAITGIAGPTGASRQKPIGLTFIAINTKDETLCLKCHFKGQRSSIKSQAATQSLKLLLEFLS